MKKDASDACVSEAGAGRGCPVPPDGAVSRSQENGFGIIPMPLSIKSKTGNSFTITGDTALVYRGEASKACAEYLQDRFATAAGLTLEMKTSSRANAIILTVASEKIAFAEKDAYCFESGEDKIAITGKSASGLFYGMQTLFQLLPAEIYSDTPVKNIRLEVAALAIEDKPAMGNIRGLHVDIARHFRTKAELLKIIDCMAMHKLNYLHLHLTDDEGWRVEIKAYPQLTTIGAIGETGNKDAPAQFLTQEELREICEYAKSRYVAIIPEIDMPGHMSAAIRTFPELKSPKEPRNPGNVIRIDSNGTDFLKKVLSEVNGLFDSEYIHIGCDEVNLGSGTIIYSNEELVGFVKEICGFIKNDLKKTPIVWDDAFIDGWHDKGTVVQWWRYDRKHWWKDLKHTVDEELNLRKQPFVFSPAYWTYFDMPNQGEGGWAEAISTAELYNWDPFADMKTCTQVTRKLAHGAIACIWSEQMATMKDLGEYTFPRLAAFSERTWRGGKRDHAAVLNWTDYRDKVLIPYQLDRYDALKVFYWSKDDPTLLATLKDARKTL